MFCAYQNISIHIVHKEDTKVTEGRSDLSHLVAVIVTQTENPLGHISPSLLRQWDRDSGVSSMPLLCAWNEVMSGEEGAVLSAACLGFFSVDFSGLQIVYCYSFESTSSQV